MKTARRILFSSFLLLLFLPGKAQAQEPSAAFSADTSKFISELTEKFRYVGEANLAESKLVLSAFTYQWTSGLLSPEQRLQARAVCLSFNEQKLQVAPYYVLYLKILTLLVKQKADPASFNFLHKSIGYCQSTKTPSQSILKYLTQTELLLREKAFTHSGTESWYARNADFRFSFDSVPCFTFTSTNLACVVRNDSACIYETRGIYYPLRQSWKGQGGTVYWERTGLGRDAVYAKLSSYTIDTRTVSYSADSVQLYHGGYFKKLLPGRLEDKAMADITAERATYPRFYMEKDMQVYINLFKDVEFFGGFNLEGARVIGTNGKEGYSRVEISHKGKLLMALRSREFVIRPDRFVSAKASAVIYLENDSVYHPGVQVHYNSDNNELVISRGEEGLGQSPFFNTYHRLDMYSGALYWILSDDFMDFEDVKGIRTKSEALFESSDYFSAYRFDKLQGIDDINPAMLVSAYVRKRNTDRFYTEDFATWAKKPLEQIKVQLITLANAGFLYYDDGKDQAVILPRLNEYLAARSGVKDSDIIQLKSYVEKGQNARLDLNNLRLSVEGVQQVMLSDSQYVYVAPRDGKLVVGKNRDFSFRGRVHAGLFDFIANECTFQYDKFALSMPKIDSALMVVPAWSPDANGYRPFVRVKNVLADVNGELFIDAPDSKSGRKMLHHFPLLISKDTSYVYFNRKDIANGVYKKDKFYFEVNPFSMDSINSLPPGDLRFNGRLVSGGIFPDMTETIRVQKDYSLGFRRVISGTGSPVYGGKGTFSDTLTLSNKGLRGSGKVSYLSSLTESSDFLFTPDSTTARVKNYQLTRVDGAAEFPDARAKDAFIRWTPASDLMTVESAGKDSIRMFNGSASLRGELAVSPTGLKGKGRLSFENAEVLSNTYNFRTGSFTSDTSDFRLLTDDRRKEALRVHVFRTEIDFATRQGHFTATGKGALMEFPVISYNCVVDEFDWLMDRKQLQLVNKTSFSREKYYQMKPEELIGFNPGSEVYTSTDPKQDSISFFALKAIYSLDSNSMQVEDVRIIKIADAAIFPGNARLMIGGSGRISELKQSSIIANRENLYHRFYNATVNIGSRKRYTAKGLYDYTPSDGEVTTLEMKNIAVNGKGETVAGTAISDSLNFQLNRYFNFRGKMEIVASSTRIGFEGGYSLIHDCDAIAKEWIKVSAQLDPKRILIPVSDDPENTGNGNLRVSLYYSTTENMIRPAFFNKVENITDPNIITANGFIVFDPKRAEYRVADSAKLRDAFRTGNQLSLSTARCMLSGEGKMQVGTGLGRLQMTSAGEISYFTLVDSTTLDLMTALDFFFPEEALKVMADAINASESKGADISSLNYTRPLREFAGNEEADKIMTELSLYGQFKRFPEVLNHSLVLTPLRLKWNGDMRSFLSQGDVGVGYIGRTPVNKLVNGYFEVSKRRSGDVINLYLVPAQDQWYFFTYSNGTLQAISSNKDFNDRITGLKEGDRVLKEEKGVPNYQFIIGTAEKKDSFLRKMRQANAEE
jgi:hypothetical protein